MKKTQYNNCVPWGPESLYAAVTVAVIITRHKFDRVPTAQHLPQEILFVTLPELAVHPEYRTGVVEAED